MQKRPRLLSFVLLTLYASCHCLYATEDPTALNQIQILLNVPHTRAQVVDAHLVTHRSSFPGFILVEDLHNHPEVQAHIAALILQGIREWGVRKVFVEGAFSEIDLSIFRAIPTEGRVRLLNQLFAEGYLSGPELAAVLHPFQLIGMEDRDLYRRNLEAYEQVQIGRPQALQELDAIDRLQRAMGIPRAHPLCQQLLRTQLLLLLKLTPASYEQFMAAKEATPSSSQLSPMIRLAEMFYELVNQRSRIFLEKIDKNTVSGDGPYLVVTGGFHTATMVKKLLEKRKSFVVLSPRVTQPGYEALYEKRMMETINAFQPFRPIVPDRYAMASRAEFRVEGHRNMPR